MRRDLLRSIIFAPGVVYKNKPLCTGGIARAFTFNYVFMRVKRFFVMDEFSHVEIFKISLLKLGPRIQGILILVKELSINR